jgi:hypothetical protein
LVAQSYEYRNDTDPSSIRTIAKELGITSPTALTWNRELVEENFILNNKDTINSPLAYKPNYEKLFELFVEHLYELSPSEKYRSFGINKLFSDTMDELEEKYFSKSYSKKEIIQFLKPLKDLILNDFKNILCMNTMFASRGHRINTINGIIRDYTDRLSVESEIILNNYYDRLKEIKNSSEEEFVLLRNKQINIKYILYLKYLTKRVTSTIFNMPTLNVFDEPYKVSTNKNPHQYYEYKELIHCPICKKKFERGKALDGCCSIDCQSKLAKKKGWNDTTYTEEDSNQLRIYTLRETIKQLETKIKESERILYYHQRGLKALSKRFDIKKVKEDLEYFRKNRTKSIAELKTIE